MIIYIDENMSPILARGFNLLQSPLNKRNKLDIEVRSIKDEFREGVPDEEWIPDAGKQQACIITQDYNIKRMKHQKALCEKYNLGMFYFRPPSKKGFTYWDMVTLIVKHWQKIAKKASKEKKPFAYKITSRGEMQEL
ncbi:MAG: hypothetical protein ACOCP4_03565 [Candidatus Woesearchaeota archaeon]